MVLALNIFFIVVIIALILSFSSGRSPIWGGVIIGSIIGIIYGIFTGDVFVGWKYGFTICGILGIISILISRPKIKA